MEHVVPDAHLSQEDIVFIKSLLNGANAFRLVECDLGADGG
jgi:hypothetical protein